MIKKILLSTIILFITFLTLPSATLAQDFTEEELAAFAEVEAVETSYWKALVISIEEVDIAIQNGDAIAQQKAQHIVIEVIRGPHKGEQKEVINQLAFNPLGLEIVVGDKLVVYIEDYNDGTWSLQIQDFWRLPILIWFILFFLVLMAIIGGKKGLRAIASLVLSILLIFKVLIPLIIIGWNPVWTSLAIAILITVLTLLIISGFHKKTYSAILGTTAGLFVAVILAMIFGNLAHLTGLSSEEARMLVSRFPDLEPRGVLFGSIIIGAIGAVMDVSMSISSSINEIKQHNPNIGYKELVKSGMNVGKDIMGTMSNTLIFAYVGTSIALLLLFTEFGESYTKFINFDFVAEEVIRSIAGSIGLIATIPFTAWIAGLFERNKG